MEKILITYATRTGYTEGVAKTIGETLSLMGETVDVIPMQDVKDLSAYKGVIAGSAIQAAHWLPEAMDFVKRNRNVLSQKPFAAFLVCMTLAMKKGEEYRPVVSGWMDPVRDLVPTVSIGLFTGGLDIKKLPSFGDRLKFKMSVMTGVWKEGDQRDWEEIREWAKDLKPLLDRGKVAAPVSGS